LKKQIPYLSIRNSSFFETFILICFDRGIVAAKRIHIELKKGQYKSKGIFWCIFYKKNFPTGHASFKYCSRRDH